MDKTFVLGFRLGVQAALAVVRSGGQIERLEALAGDAEEAELAFHLVSSDARMPAAPEPVEIKRMKLLDKLRQRVGDGVPEAQWHSITARELWASNRNYWKNTPAARAFLDSLVVDADGVPGPLVVGQRGRYFLREARGE